MSARDFLSKLQDCKITFEQECPSCPTTFPTTFANGFTNDPILSLTHSYQYEGASCNFSQLVEIVESPNSIEKLIHIIEPTNETTIRTDPVIVCGNVFYGTNSMRVDALHVGANYKQIKLDILQSFVDDYYKFDFENEVQRLFAGYVLYLLYERVHPHSDGNGRIGRYLFLENPKLPQMIPLSIALNKSKRVNKKHSKIFKHANISFPQSFADDEEPISKDIEEYLTINISKDLEELITELIMSLLDDIF